VRSTILKIENEKLKVSGDFRQGENHSLSKLSRMKVFGATFFQKGSEKSS